MTLGYPKRWLAYFDILGFSKMVENSALKENPFMVAELYDAALQEASSDSAFSEAEKHNKISRVHFSDTFIFYSEGEEKAAYAWIQLVSKNFIRRCLMKEIPFRGAIAYGDFYANREKGIYFGNALNEAYVTAESQDWIGLILTDSAQRKTKEYGLNPSHHNFPLVPVPIKEKNKKRSVKLVEFPAYSFHADKSLNQSIGFLERMKKMATKPEVKRKYQNTIDYMIKVSGVKKT